MERNLLANLKIDRTAFSVASLNDATDEKEYCCRVLPTSALDRWKFFEESTMDIELPLDFKEFLKLLNEKNR